MPFPILAKELRLSLRRQEAFTTAFTVYALLTVLVTLIWESRVGSVAPALLSRSMAGLSIFWTFLLVGYPAFCLYGSVVASRVLVIEREKNTEDILRSAPIGRWTLVLQKAITPLLVEVLYFVGVIPFLSIVFLLGGVSGAVFRYGLTSLFIWIVTSVSIGLWISSKSTTTVKSVRRTFIVVFAILILPSVIAYVFQLACLFLRTEFGNNALISSISFVLELVGWVLHVVSPIGMALSAPLSPMSLVGSMQIPWGPGLSAMLGSLGVGSGDAFLRQLLVEIIGERLTGFLLPASYTYSGFAPKPFLGWSLHLIIQASLLWRAAQNWFGQRRTPRMGGIHRLFASRRGNANSPSAIFWPGWRAFHQMEERTNFKLGKKIKLFYVVVFFLTAVSASVYWPETASTTVLLLTVGGISLVSFILAPNALRRERETDTAVFLLSSPNAPRTYLFGKWIYYQLHALGLWFLGFLCALTIAGTYTFVPGIYHVLNFNPFYFLLALIPLFTLEGLMIGLRVKKKRQSPVRLLLPLGILATGVTFLYVFSNLTDLVNFFGNIAWSRPWLTTCLVPSMLLAVAVYLLHQGWEAPYGEAPKRKKRRQLISRVLGCYVLADCVYSVFFPYDYTGMSIPLVIRSLLVAVALSWLPWVWLIKRPEKWWRERLMKEEV